MRDDEEVDSTIVFRYCILQHRHVPLNMRKPTVYAENNNILSSGHCMRNVHQRNDSMFGKSLQLINSAETKIDIIIGRPSAINFALVLLLSRWPPLTCNLK
ncbi:hypothetical protein Bhyg_11431 [Pseudolycoriella hygida]|uniref:Uncharacterized protein n=1 Tax=Pseudolycoriella hygida TaxID=35572 RepID=A0A9Q0MWX8_9DIPT|nr:hypothetical protein Bhyg_11431 [Pseudolycoriella hygida]